MNDATINAWHQWFMTQPDAIHSGKTPRRNHYIPEWAERRGLTKAEIARATGADKGLVSRWFNQRIIPSERYLEVLAGVLEADEPAALFRDPYEDWLSRFFAGRSEEERQRMMTTLEAAFPRKHA